MAANAPAGSYKLVTVNTTPERAKVIIGRVVEAVKERYTIDYAANAESIFAHLIDSTLALLGFVEIFSFGGFKMLMIIGRRCGWLTRFCRN